MATSVSVRALSNRRGYSLLLGAGLSVLCLGLILPFVIADPAKVETTAARTAPSILTAGDSATAAASDPAAGPATTGLPGSAAAAAGGGTAATAPRAAVSRAGLTASDVGITADTITLGIPIPDVAAFGQGDSGGVSFGDPTGDPLTQWKAFVEDLNARGGIQGRHVNAVYRQYSLIDPDTMRAACIYLTEEVKVFAVLGGFYGDPILCITEQHHTPLIQQAAEGDDFYQRSKGLFFSTAMSKDRTLRNLVAGMDRNGELKNKTIGLLDGEGIDAVPVDRTLIPALKERGYKITYHARIIADASAAQSQIPLEVQRMRSAGVDLILPATNLLVADIFAQEADSQRYHPQYILSDFAGGATDFYAKAMPASFEGSIGYTSLRTGEARAGLPEAPQDTACRHVYEARSGKKLDPNTSEFYLAVTSCGELRWFEQAANAVGPQLTRTALSRALQGLGRFQTPFGAGGSFTPSKTDAPDTLRRVTWKANCTCWLPIEQFQPVAY